MDDTALNVGDSVRRLMATSLREIDPSLTVAQSHEAVDLGVHAANEAALAIDRVCRRGSDAAVTVYAIQSAFCTMDAYMRAKITMAHMVVEAMGGPDEPPVNLH